MVREKRKIKRVEWQTGKREVDGNRGERKDKRLGGGGREIEGKKEREEKEGIGLKERRE